MPLEVETLFASLPPNLPKPPPVPVEGLPEQLQGKTPKEIYEMLKVEHNRVIGEIQTNQPTAPPPPENVPEPPAAPSQLPNQQLQVPYPGGQQPAAEPVFYDDPEKYMDMQFQRRMGPLVGAFVQSQRETNRQLLINKVGDENYKKYEKEIEPFMDQLTPTLQGDFRAYEAAYRNAQSAHVDEISNEQSNTKAAKIVQDVLTNLGVPKENVEQVVAGIGKPPEAPAQTPVPTSLFQNNVGVVPQTEAPKPYTGGGGTPASKLTPEQKKMAEQFEMTDDEYAQYYEMNTDIITNVQKGIL